MRPTNALLPLALSLPLALAAGCDRRPTPSPVVLEAAAQGGFEPGAPRPADTYLAGPRPVEVNAPMVSPPSVPMMAQPVAPPAAPAPQVVIQLIVPYATDAAGNTGAASRFPLPAGASSSVIVVPVVPPGSTPYAVAPAAQGPGTGSGITGTGPANAGSGSTGTGSTTAGATGSGSTGTGSTDTGTTGSGATGSGSTGSGTSGSGATGRGAGTPPSSPPAPGPVQPSAPQDDLGVGNTGPRGFQNNGADRRDPGPPTVYGSP